MKTKFLTCLLVVCIFAINYTADAQQKFSTRENGADFNSTQKQGVELGLQPPTDVISASWTTLAVSVKAQSRTFVVYAKPGGGEYLYQFGGGAGAQLTSIARYDIAANTWTLLGQILNFAVSSGAAINDGDSVIYIFGGNNPTLGKTQKFNIGTGITTTLADMPNLVTDAAVVKYQDSLVYVIGGGTGLFGAGYISNVNVYNKNTNTYAAATAYPIVAGMQGFGIDGNKIIVAAGWTGTTGTALAYKGVIDAGNHLNIVWTAIPNYPGGPVTRSASYLVNKPPVLGDVANKGIMFTGGAVNGATLTNKTYFFNTECEQWDSTAPNSQARSNFKAAGRGDSVAWVAGGFTTVGVGTTERITFSIINCVQLTNDVSCLSINSPPASINLPSPPIAPQATVKNVGSATQTFNVTMTISPAGYSSTKTVTSLTSNSTSNVDFDPYTPAIGDYTVTVYTQLATDENRANDTCRQSLAVRNPNYGSGGSYSFANSVLGSGAPSQPEYCWKDTTGSTSLVVNSVNSQPGIFNGSLDDGHWKVGNALGGKRIRFGGVNYDSVFICTNGTIGFAFNSSLNSFTPTTTSTNRPAFYPLWIDLNFTSQILAQPNRVSYKVKDGFQLIITYDRAPEFNPVDSDWVSMQIVIDLVDPSYPSDSRLLAQFADATNGNTGNDFITFYNSNTLNNHVVGLQTTGGTTNLYYRAALPVPTISGPLFGSSPIAVQFGPNAARLDNRCGAGTLTLTALLEGPYEWSTNFNSPVTVCLRNSTSPYETVDADEAVLDSGTGNGTFTFTKINTSGSYYVVVKSLFGIETWSANPVGFPSDVSYDFTSGTGQAFGGNTRQIGSISAFFVGDVNQDGIVDGTDAALVDNDIFNFAPGFGATDVNWDGVVDGTDAQYVDNNAFNFIGVIAP